MFWKTSSGNILFAQLAKGQQTSSNSNRFPIARKKGAINGCLPVPDM